MVRGGEHAADCRGIECKMDLLRKVMDDSQTPKVQGFGQGAIESWPETLVWGRAQLRARNSHVSVACTTCAACLGSTSPSRLASPSQ